MVHKKITWFKYLKLERYSWIMAAVRAVEARLMARVVVSLPLTLDEVGEAMRSEEAFPKLTMLTSSWRWKNITGSDDDVPHHSMEEAREKFCLGMKAEHLAAEEQLDAQRADVVVLVELYTNPAFYVQNRSILESIEDERVVMANYRTIFIHDIEREKTLEYVF